MRTKIGVLKGFKNGKGEILIFMAITKGFTLEQFQNSRIRHIEALKHKYDRFETELI